MEPVVTAFLIIYWIWLDGGWRYLWYILKALELASEAVTLSRPLRH